ncbi:hypothetical protein RN001_003215 [Aquatica leii]|uniref:Spt20-like SEP domain-containing protein n=1 Tax=Aquatica leii TaxID=1421715 RepID=A0AAN7PI04_9COLE|nr:hypothetical protein RN001_003215 [Aquatica leii]
MQSLEAACEEGEHTYKKAKISRSSLPAPRPQEIEQTEVLTTKKTFCIHTKLKELHIEECAKDPNQNSTGLKRNSLLLEKLVAQERLNTVIVNLYPGNKGFSLAFRVCPRTDNSDMGLSVFDDTANMLETRQWPYEEDEMLRCIDNEELPAYFLDLFDKDFSFLFYSGCIIAEVRDYRQSYPHFKCDIHHVLLKPSLQSVLADIHSITEDKVDWGTEEKQQLESQILIAKNPTLCLDPDPSVCTMQSNLNYSRQLLNTHRLRRYARKFSQVTVNRKRKLDQFTHRPGLELYDYITRLRARSKTGVALSSANSKVAKKIHDDIKPIPVPNLDVQLLNPPSQGVVINEFKAYERPKETSDCLPQLIEEYVLETDMPSKEKGKSRVYHIKLSILQRPSNSEYLGELYLDRDHKKDEKNGVACRFSLGTRAHANQYIKQFTEIFTEGGRKSVRIKYGLSQGYRERIALAQAQAQMQSQNTVQVNLAQQQLAHLGQNIQSPPCVMPLVNGTVGAGITLVQPNQNVQNSSVPILQTQVQSNQAKLSNSEIEINALATKLMNSAQQFQAAANAKQQQQQQQQKLASVSNNAAIINLLNSSPASNINSDASAAVVNAINNTASVSLLPHQMQTINQKLIGRKMTLSNVSNARVLNNSNLITVNNNNNRMTLSDLSSHLTAVTQTHTVTLTTANANFAQTNYSNVPIKQVVNQRVLTTPNANDNKSALSALLVGTPAADRPDIVGPNTSSLLLEKLACSSGTTPIPTQSPTNFIQSPKAQYTVQSPKSVISPLSSPPPQNTGTINVQSLNFTPIQNISGLQNVQVQLPGFSQPISLSLNVSSAGTIQGHPTSIIVSLPVTTATATATSITQQATTTLVTSVTSPTVVLTNAGAGNLAQLVSSGVKGINQQNLRATGPTGVTLSQAGQQFQLLTPLQRPRMQQTGIQQNITARGVQRTPITIKMATPNATAAQVTLPTNTSMSSLSNQQLQFTLQKQAQLQQYQQLCMNQQKNITQNITAKVRRRSNASDPQP